MWPLKSFIEREGSGGDRGLDARRRSMKRWRQRAKAMSIRWRGDFNGRRMLIRANAMSRGGPKATLAELAKHWRNSRSSSDRSVVPYTGVKILPKLWEKVWVRRGGDEIEGDSQKEHAPSCPIHHVEKRKSSWRQGPEEWGSTKPMKVQEQHLSSGRAITGPQGAISESLSMGLGLYHWAPLTGTF